jgi:hypothetical protein
MSPAPEFPLVALAEPSSASSFYSRGRIRAQFLPVLKSIPASKPMAPGESAPLGICCHSSIWMKVTVQPPTAPSHGLHHLQPPQAGHQQRSPHVRQVGNLSGSTPARPTMREQMQGSVRDPDGSMIISCRPLKTPETPETPQFISELTWFPAGFCSSYSANPS